MTVAGGAMQWRGGGNGAATRSVVPLVIAIATAIVVLDALAWAFGDSPVGTLRRSLEGTWGTAYGIGQVLFKATPLLFCGAAVAVALRAGLFNIGAEGQLAVASLAGATLGAALPRAVPWPLAVPAVLAGAAAAGAAWAGLAGWLRARFGAHEVISTILLNRVAAAAVAFALGTGLSLPGTVRTADVAPSARIAPLGRWVPAWSGSAASLAFVVAVAVVFAVAAWERRARAGREIGWVGLGARACAAEGIPVERRVAQAMALSGALAGLAMSGTVLGYKGYFEQGLGAGAGFGGIAVALLGRGRPVGMVAAALLFGTLDQAGLVVNARVPREAMDILQAVVIVTLALADAWVRRSSADGDAAPRRPRGSEVGPAGATGTPR